MLDEFPALGRLAFFQESLAYLAGYGIRAFLITQDLSQHYGVYGREEAITGNCHVRIAFTANKPETAELLGRMAGDMTVHIEQRSYRGDRFDLVLNQQYVAQQQVRRPLLTRALRGGWHLVRDQRQAGAQASGRAAPHPSGCGRPPLAALA